MRHREKSLKSGPFSWLFFVIIMICLHYSHQVDAGPWLPQCVQAEDEAAEYYYGRGVREPEDEQMTSKFLGPRDLPRVNAARAKVASMEEASDDGALSLVPLNPPELAVCVGSSADGAAPVLALEDIPTNCPETNVKVESTGELAAPVLALEDGSVTDTTSLSPSPSPPRVVPPRVWTPKKRTTPHRPRVVPPRVWEPVQSRQQWWQTEAWDGQDAWASWHWNDDWQQHWWA